VLFEAPAALEIVSRPSNLVTVRTTAGATFLQVHTFVGNDPSQVFDALTTHIGQSKEQIFKPAANLFLNHALDY